MYRKTSIHITGVVQGVGFRPFIHNLAHKYHLKGFCLNDSQGVLIEVQGDMIHEFIQEITSSPPPLSKIESIAAQILITDVTYKDFSIRESVFNEENFSLVSPDIALCENCLRELFDPADRRYLYPFINCTNCGPRFSIIKDIPYDRSMTTMASFTMCEACEKDYHDPGNRRFHAQPNGCHECGPRVWLEQCDNLRGTILDFGVRISDLKAKFKTNRDTVIKAISLLKEGYILAIKGLGGFHLACDATNYDAVKKLRGRKRKSNKPFALMAPDIDTVESICVVSEEERILLEGRVRPILILEKTFPNLISEAVAPHNKNFGVLLPYTPLHYLLFSSSGVQFTALVMTSGNVSDEPIVTSNQEAIEKLSSLADYVLFHDRDIFMRVDDSIVRIVKPTGVSTFNAKIQNPKSKIQTFRRARGFVPKTIDIGEEMKDILACGAELKNTFCLTRGTKAILSQYIGDLENYETLEFLKETLKNLKKVFRVTPEIIAHDLHPDYLSTRFALEYADEMDIPTTNIVPVQHHHAHMVSCMAEHNLNGEVIGVAFDGTGYGTDGNIWGGEFFIVSRENFIRKAHLDYVPMPGGEKAIQEPWRMTVAYLYQTFGDDIFKAAPSFLKRFNQKDVEIIITMIKKKINTPLTSSVGRLFDAMSSLLGIRDTITFEGEAAIELEMAADSREEQELRSYPFRIIHDDPIIVDIKPLIKSVGEDLIKSVKIAAISYRFHRALVMIIVEISKILKTQCEIRDVVLSGGVFQNKLLLNLAVTYLEKEGFQVWFNEQFPANDGGISLGQAVIAWERLRGR
ncbi:MAG: carbamoyltransferase HypF [Candidatus Brocadiaceae bacterium]